MANRPALLNAPVKRSEPPAQQARELVPACPPSWAPLHQDGALCPCKSRRPPGVKQAYGRKTQPLEFERRRKGVKTMGIQTNNPREDSFRRPPLAEFGVDAARSFSDHTTGVGGTGVMPRRCRWRSGSRRSPAGCTKTGIVGKIHLDIIITMTLLHHWYMIRIVELRGHAPPTCSQREESLRPLLHRGAVSPNNVPDFFFEKCVCSAWAVGTLPARHN